MSASWGSRDAGGAAWGAAKTRGRAVGWWKARQGRALGPARVRPAPGRLGLLCAVLVRPRATRPHLQAAHDGGDGGGHGGRGRRHEGRERGPQRLWGGERRGAQGAGAQQGTAHTAHAPHVPPCVHPSSACPRAPRAPARTSFPSPSAPASPATAACPSSAAASGALRPSCAAIAAGCRNEHSASKPSLMASAISGLWLLSGYSCGEGGGGRQRVSGSFASVGALQAAGRNGRRACLPWGTARAAAPPAACRGATGWTAPC